VHGADGNVRTANRLACTLLGLSHDDIVGREPTCQAWGFLRGDESDMPACEYPVNLVLSEGSKVSDVVVGVRHDADAPVRWLICNAYPAFDHDGQLDHVVVCFTDCTALEATKKRLEKSEERLRLVVRGSSDAPWDCDLQTGEYYYSARWFEMLGHRPGELVGDAGLCLQLMHPDDAPHVKSFMRRLLAGGEQDYSLEFRLRHRDGHFVPIQSRGFILRDTAGRAKRVSGTNTDLTERKRAEKRIYEAAYFDHLTGLPNRRYLVEELRKVLLRSHRSGRFNALLFLDLDHFKLLNDASGPDAGDRLLREAARCFRSASREGDHLARVGGDEFVAVMEDVGTSERDAATEAFRIVQLLVSALDEANRAACIGARVNMSVGVVLFDGATTRIKHLIQQAEMAMHQAKREGGNTTRFFDKGMQDAVEKQAALHDALCSGLQRREFSLYCQPQCDAQGRLVGAETLVRGRREGSAMLMPGEFIGIAEATGLILPLGKFVLEESCRTLACWAADPGLAHLKLAVNVSVHQLRHADFVSQVANTLARTGARPDLLWLELTETVFADDIPQMVHRMHELRTMGVRFSLDDFGTGYSSLAYLKRLPFAGLKIDRSFVHDLHTDADTISIVEAIVALARALHLEIVAEGVEHELQRDVLSIAGCDILQGYLFGRPMPIGDFEQLYGTRSGARNYRTV